jgi:uroporphyrinogen-III decarboxylase
MASTAEMTPKERWLAALSLEPVDRLPFWPKLDAAYPVHRKGRFHGVSIDDLHDYIGSDKHCHIGNAVKEIRASTSQEHTRDGDEMRFLFRTPHGDLTRVHRFDHHSQSWHPMEFPVKTADDLAAMTAFYADCEPALDEEALKKVWAQYDKFGSDSLVVTGVGQSPLMHWVEWLAGVENAHFMLHDHEAEVLAMFAEMHRCNVRRAEILAEHHPADAFYMGENTSTTLISVDQYRSMNVGHITEYAQIMRSHARHMILHMCGHLKAILPDLARVPCSAFEAFTAPTLGNTTLLDGRSLCPDKCLVGGTQAPDWLLPPERIISRIERSLDELPHHRGVVVTSAGVMPPWCEPDTIRSVCEWVKGYPANVSPGQ